MHQLAVSLLQTVSDSQVHAVAVLSLEGANLADRAITLLAKLAANGIVHYSHRSTLGLLRCSLGVLLG